MNVPCPIDISAQTMVQDRPFLIIEARSIHGLGLKWQQNVLGVAEMLLAGSEVDQNALAIQ